MALEEHKDVDAALPGGIVDGVELGRRIRRARLARGLTLKQVERATDVSATHLSEIERGKCSPTVGALARIAHALEHEPGWFLEAEEREEVLHLPRTALRSFSPAPGVTVEILTLGIPGSQMAAYRLRMDAGAPVALELRSPNVTAEAVYVVRQGAVACDPGDGAVSLVPGDALQATFLRPHRLTASGEEAGEVILVASPPVRLVSLG